MYTGKNHVQHERPKDPKWRQEVSLLNDLVYNSMDREVTQTLHRVAQTSRQQEAPRDGITATDLRIFAVTTFPAGYTASRSSKKYFDSRPCCTLPTIFDEKLSTQHKQQRYCNRFVTAPTLNKLLKFTLGC